jgi:hypothetical protein
VVANAEPLREGSAIAVVAIEELQDAGRRTGGADPLLDAGAVDGIDHPDAAPLDERVGTAFHELVLDPAEAVLELVAGAGLHSAESTGTP